MSARDSSAALATLRLSAALCQALVDDARQAGHHEICGFIALGRAVDSRPTRYVVGNRAAMPASHFDMDPAQQIAAVKQMRERGEQLIAIYHSHPSSPAMPSAHDLAGHSYPSVPALIISPHAAPNQRLCAWALNGPDARPITLVRC